MWGRVREREGDVRRQKRKRGRESVGESEREREGDVRREKRKRGRERLVGERERGGYTLFHMADSISAQSSGRRSRKHDL